MTEADVESLAKELGLHCDFDDDPIDGETPTIYLWHDCDRTADGGLVIELVGEALCLAEAGSLSDVKGRHGDPNHIVEAIRHYAARWSHIEPAPVELEEAATARVVRDRQTPRLSPDGRKPNDWRILSQRKLGEFKAFDVLGHAYQIEIFCEVFPGMPAGPPKLVTAEGEWVQRMDKGLYQIVEHAITLTSPDPRAP